MLPNPARHPAPCKCNCKSHQSASPKCHSLPANGLLARDSSARPIWESARLPHSLSCHDAKTFSHDRHDSSALLVHAQSPQYNTMQSPFQPHESGIKRHLSQCLLKYLPLPRFTKWYPLSAPPHHRLRFPAILACPAMTTSYASCVSSSASCTTAPSSSL